MNVNMEQYLSNTDVFLEAMYVHNVSTMYGKFPRIVDFATLNWGVTGHFSLIFRPMHLFRAQPRLHSTTFCFNANTASFLRIFAVKHISELSKLYRFSNLLWIWSIHALQLSLHSQQPSVRVLFCVNYWSYSGDSLFSFPRERVPPNKPFGGKRFYTRNLDCLLNLRKQEWINIEIEYIGHQCETKFDFSLRGFSVPNKDSNYEKLSAGCFESFSLKSVLFLPERI